MPAFKNIVSRNIVVYGLIGFVLAVSVDWNKCVIQRGRYLLGIYYNGFFKNEADGLVYRDYLLRHGLTDETFRKMIGI